MTFRNLGRLVLLKLLLFFSLSALPYQFKSEGMAIKLETLAEDLEIPWGMDFANKTSLLFTEKQGKFKLLNLKTKKVIPIPGAPKVYAQGQGGLLDLRFHPKDKSKLYFTFSKKVPGGNTTVLAQAQFDGKKVFNMKEIFEATPPGKREIHFGSRLAFDKKGHLFLSIGDRGDRHKAQRLDFHHGKILRLKLDGSIPTDNPFQSPKAKKEIWSLGHRNPQGLFYHQGTLWAQEHGPRGGDEINIIEKAKNYGWPIITYGREYWGPKIGTTKKAGLEQPIKYFTPSIAPCGFLIYQGNLFPKWKGDLFSGALKLTHLNRLKINKKKVIKEERLLKEVGLRVRSLREGPNGEIYLGVDNGKILRLVLAK